MKCPHCRGSIGMFSRALNRLGKVKTCPYCGNSIRLFISFKVAGLLFVPSVALAFLLRPVFVSFGLSGSLAIGLTTAVLVALAMRLKAA
jgi:hypothetical protein